MSFNYLSIICRDLDKYVWLIKWYWNSHEKKYNYKNDGFSICHTSQELCIIKHLFTNYLIASLSCNILLRVVCFHFCAFYICIILLFPVIAIFTPFNWSAGNSGVWLMQVFVHIFMSSVWRSVLFCSHSVVSCMLQCLL